MHLYRWYSLPLLLCGLAVASALPARAVGRPDTVAPRQMIVQYFADLNAHRLYAAWLLSAPCNITYTTSNGPGSPEGTGGFAGRGPWAAPRGVAAQHPILVSAHVTAVRRLHIRELERHGIRAFGVSGWYRFDYSAFPAANDRHGNGFHVVKIAMWKCAGRWGVEPSYWVSSGGGALNWT